jgi:multicomponent K+:H+ antiporter subunit G
MNAAGEISALSATLTVTLLIGGAAITLIGSLGLLRLRSFYERVHAPTLGTTLGTTSIAFASMIYFSALGARPVLHEMLIIAFITVTTPISLMVVVRAAVFRNQSENEGTSPRRLENEPG